MSEKYYEIVKFDAVFLKEGDRVSWRRSTELAEGFAKSGKEMIYGERKFEQLFNIVDGMCFAARNLIFLLPSQVLPDPRSMQPDTWIGMEIDRVGKEELFESCIEELFAIAERDGEELYYFNSPIYALFEINVETVYFEDDKDVEVYIEFMGELDFEKLPLALKAMEDERKD